MCTGANNILEVRKYWVYRIILFSEVSRYIIGLMLQPYEYMAYPFVSSLLKNESESVDP